MYRATVLPHNPTARPALLSLLSALMLAAALLVVQTLGAAAQDRPASFADLAEDVSPAVVNITTSTRVAGDMGRGGPRLPDGAPFQDFFNEFFNREGPGGRDGPGAPPRPRQSQSLGSGFVISPDGLIVTNNHVIEGADEIRIEFFSGLELSATLVGTDPATDIALLRVEHDAELPHVPWGDSEATRVGDWVLAVGNPLGQGFSVSAGIISARGRALQGNFDDYLQTDAAINRGNSGGPLFNMAGEVVGVNTAILSPTGGSIGIGFAMSSNVAARVVEQLQEFGAARRGWLGVRIQDVSAEVAEAMDLPAARGALVTEVMDGPARAAGIRSGDVITRFNGNDVSDTRDLVRRVADAGVDIIVDVTVMREGSEQVVQVTLGLRDDGAPSAPGQPRAPSGPVEMMGMELAELTPSMREDMALPSGVTGLVVREVMPGSDADSKGIRAGDIITEAGQEPVASIADFQRQVDAARDAGRRNLLVMVRRGDDPRFVALSLDN